MEDKEIKAAQKPKCCIEGCEREHYLKHIATCRLHYSRRRGQGLPTLFLDTKPEKKSRYANGNGYYFLSRKGHPLASKSGNVLEHRYVAYEKYGEGQQSCHWCDKSLTWKELHVDHLDWDRGNNHPDNLVTSCPLCNKMRLSPREIKEANSATSNPQSARIRDMIKRD